MLTSFAVVDLQNYPDSAFLFIMGIGVYLIRRQRKKLGFGRAPFKAWDVAVLLFILTKAFLLVMPWYPPKGGANGGDVSFWYATYCVVGLGMYVVHIRRAEHR